MKLPQINDMITTEQALALCKHFDLDYLIKRSESNPNTYKPWKFDGCSGLHDDVMDFFTFYDVNHVNGCINGFMRCDLEETDCKTCQN